MAYIRRRGDSYVVRYEYKDNRGQPCEGWETFSNAKEAKKRKKEIEYELERGTFLAPTTVTVEELVYKWLEFACVKHKWAPKTYISNRSTIQNLICPYIGGMNVQKINAFHLESLYIRLSKTPCGLYVEGKKRKLTPKQAARLLSGTTIHDVHRLLRTAFDYAVEWGLVPKNPVPKDAPAKTTEERATWDKETMLAALDSMQDNPLLHLAVHLTLVGSLREGELLGLTPEDFDLESNYGNGSFSVNKTMQRVDKDALKRVNPSLIVRTFEDKREYSKSSLILKTTKTKASIREIYMNPFLKREVQAWFEKLKQDEAQYGERYQNCGMLFRLPNGDAVEPTLIRKWFEQWQNAHPEFERIVFHALRHSSATYYLTISGGDIKAVQGNTGHAQAGTLVNIYEHIQKESRKNLTRKFNHDFYAGREPTQTELLPPAQAAGQGPVDITALLQALQSADPMLKKQLAMALFA